MKCRMKAERRSRLSAGRAGLAAAVFSVLCGACGWNPSRPFDRDAPAVTEAMKQINGGDAAAAAVASLEDYLSTGPCKGGNIGTPDSLKQRADGTFDLGLALFRTAEQFGRRFGEEEEGAGRSDENVHERRHDSVECARRVVQVVVDDPTQNPELRARALYLQGNLAFLDGEYEDAVRAYDSALTIAPGQNDAGDEVGRDAAWNRAIALRRIDDKKDAGSDASPPSSDGGNNHGDGGNSQGDGGDNHSKDSGAPSSPDAGGGGHDAGSDGSPPSPPPEPPDAGENPPEAGPPPPTNQNEDDRMLDQLENAPTLQQEEAKRAHHTHARGTVDK
jgi:hypothetical protein